MLLVLGKISCFSNRALSLLYVEYFLILEGNSA